MIEVRHLAKSFAAPAARRRGMPLRRRARAAAGEVSAAPVRLHAVRDVSFDAPDGCITGLLGPNGAGKTTTLRMLAALIAPDAGTMRVDHIDVAARPRDVLARMGVLSDARGLYPRLTARENIVYYGALQGMGREAAEARAQELARMFDMTSLLDRRAAGFSQGERMKTALARALVHDPANIVLDEPTNGLDVLATRALRDSLRWLRSPKAVRSASSSRRTSCRRSSASATASSSSPMGGPWPRAPCPSSSRGRHRATSRKPSSGWRSCPRRMRRGRRLEALLRGGGGGARQGAARRAARSPDTGHGAGLVGAHGPAGPARDFRARRLAGGTGRTARGLRRRPRQRADAAQLPRAADLSS